MKVWIMSVRKESNNPGPLKGITIDNEDTSEKDVSVCENMRDITCESNSDCPSVDVIGEVNATSEDGNAVGSKGNSGLACQNDIL